MEQYIQLKGRIMRRIYLIYALRSIFSLNGVRILILGAFLFELSPFSPYLSLGNIVANMPAITNIKALYIFHLTAFLHTQPVVQISIIAVLFVLSTYIYRLLSVAVSRISPLGFLGHRIAR